jgi:hypothetical protein
MSKKSLAALFASAAIFGLAGAGTANAVPVYGFAELLITNFALNTGGASIDASSVSGQNSAGYPGSAAQVINTPPGNIFTGVDVAQATSGPGAFPAQNTFSQALLPVSGNVGTRADLLISGAIGGGGPTPTSASLVAEGNLMAGGSAASSAAGTGTTLTIHFVAVGGTISLSFNGQAILQASVGTTGDSSKVQTTITGSVCPSDGSGCLLITDLIRPAQSGTTIAPSLLNRTASTQTAGPGVSIDTGVQSFAYSVSGLTAGASYDITLTDSVQDLLTSVPEPVSLAMFGSALIGLALVRRRRKQSATV